MQWGDSYYIDKCLIFYFACSEVFFIVSLVLEQFCFHFLLMLVKFYDLQCIYVAADMESQLVKKLARGPANF